MRVFVDNVVLARREKERGEKETTLWATRISTPAYPAADTWSIKSKLVANNARTRAALSLSAIAT